MYSKVLTKIAATTSLLMLPAVAFAQNATGLQFSLLEGDLVSIIISIIQTLLILIGVAALIMLIIGGVQYVISMGNDDKVGSAKNTILYAIVGLIVVALAYVIITFVTGTILGGA